MDKHIISSQPHTLLHHHLRIWRLQLPRSNKANLATRPSNARNLPMITGNCVFECFVCHCLCKRLGRYRFDTTIPIRVHNPITKNGSAYTRPILRHLHTSPSLPRWITGDRTEQQTFSTRAIFHGSIVWKSSLCGQSD